MLYSSCSTLRSVGNSFIQRSAIAIVAIPPSAAATLLAPDEAVVVMRDYLKRSGAAGIFAPGIPDATASNVLAVMRWP
jgi:hypothetical protein